MSGAALADLAGLGVVVIKAMRDQRYPVPFAAAVMLAACVLGPIIPPSIVFVIYGLATDTSVGRLFLAGIPPGRPARDPADGPHLGLHADQEAGLGPPRALRARANAWNSFRGGAFALLSPFVVIGAILAGVATPSEIGAIAAAYALLAGRGVRRAQRPRAGRLHEGIRHRHVGDHVPDRGVVGDGLDRDDRAHRARRRAVHRGPRHQPDRRAARHQPAAACCGHVPGNRAGVADPVADPASGGQGTRVSTPSISG